MTRILVTGGTGVLGRALVARLRGGTEAGGGAEAAKAGGDAGGGVARTKSGTGADGGAQQKKAGAAPRKSGGAADGSARGKAGGTRRKAGGAAGGGAAPTGAGAAEVRVLSRREHDEPGFVRGDLETGEGLAAALDGVDTIAHCASAADYRHPERDVAAARRLLAESGGRHVVYISIVGVDEIPFGYYRAKLDTERLIESSGAPWTVLRTTQFHELVVMALSMIAKPPLVLVPDMAVQPVDVGEVADRMAQLVLGEPAGRVADLGGPRVERLPDLMHSYLAATRSRRPMLKVPVRLPGRLIAAFRSGQHLTPEHADGTVTFDDHLRAVLRANDTIAPAYDWRR